MSKTRKGSDVDSSGDNTGLYQNSGTGHRAVLGTTTY